MNRTPRHPWLSATLALALCGLASSTRAGLVPRWQVESDQASSGFGLAAASIGDVNGDGYEDIAVGAPFWTNGQTNEGKVFIYYGGPDGYPATPSWTLESNQAGALYGWSVTQLGDANGDGYDDMAVGAPLFDHTLTDEGAVFVYFGSDSGLTTTFAGVLYGGKAGALFGAAIAGGGDVEEDGYDDLLVGSPQYTNGQTREGRAQMFRGSDTGFKGASWSYESNVAESQLGSAVGFADINGDFQSDVVVGAPYFKGAWVDEGRVQVFRAVGPALENNPSSTFTGGRANARFGSAVSSALYFGTDVNSDGYDDIGITAPGWSENGSAVGAVKIYLGSETGLGTQPLWTLKGSQPEAGYGTSIHIPEDVDGDGPADIVIGAPGFSWTHVRAGRVTVVYGDFGAEFSMTNAFPPSRQDVLDGDEDGGALGMSLSTTDLNSDFQDEVLIGAPPHSGPIVGQGRAVWARYSNILTGVSPTASNGAVRIESVAPNPARRGFDIWLALGGGPAQLELVDVTGRRVRSLDLQGLGPGRHRFSIPADPALAPGVYLVRLVEGRNVATAKVAVIR